MPNSVMMNMVLHLPPRGWLYGWRGKGMNISTHNGAESQEGIASSLKVKEKGSWDKSTAESKIVQISAMLREH